MSDCQGLGDCDDTRMQRIYEYLDGALTRSDLAEIKHHLDECPECAQQYDFECVIRKVVKRSCTEAAPENLGFDGDRRTRRSGSRTHGYLVNAPCKTIGANTNRTDFALAA